MTPRRFHSIAAPMPASGSADSEVADEVLVERMRLGENDACAELYRRHAGLIFGIAARSLDAAAAEDVVQEVFATAWRKAQTYDAARGPVRAWILRIAHSRILNELRRRSRKPVSPEPDEGGLDALVAADSAPDDAVWREHRRRAVRSAVDALPPPQRRALVVAFFDELTREQAAEFLDAPVGTVKTRVRAALAKLRGRLVPYAVGGVLVAACVAGALRWMSARDAAERRERALRLTTSSDVVPIRLGAVGSADPATHANWRGRAGTNVAVMTFSRFAPPPAGRVYVAWAKRDGAWSRLGSFVPDESGATLLVIEGPEVAVPPSALEATVESAGEVSSPSGEVVVSWERPGGR